MLAQRHGRFGRGAGDKVAMDFEVFDLDFDLVGDLKDVEQL
jgi:hypothetical protein